jgi:hypothetical protein
MKFCEKLYQVPGIPFAIMVVFYLEEFISAFTTLIHFYIHAAFFICSGGIGNTGRFELIAAIKRLYTQAKSSRSVNAD